MDGDGDWSRSNRAQDGRSSSLWDDGPGTGMGLEQFAAKALQFRQDMEELKIRGDEDVMAAAARAAEEDNMERLIRDEEAYRAGVAAGAAGGGSRGGGGGAGGCLEGVLGDGEDSLGGLVQGELDVEDEDEELPDWADDDAEADADGALAETAAPQESKRNLLMEVSVPMDGRGAVLFSASVSMSFI